MKSSVVTVSLFSRSVGVGRCFQEKVSVRFGVGVFFKALCTANATNAVPGTALMLGAFG